MRKNLLYTLMLFLSATIIVSCSDDDDDDLYGNWVEKGAFEGYNRSDAVAFTIDNYAYVGTGYNGDEDIRMNDFWRYDPDKDYWTEVASMAYIDGTDTIAAVERQGAVAFTADGKGYVTTGYDGRNRLNDTYAYDPSTNTWTKKADFPGEARYGAVAFALYEKGYVGSGNCYGQFKKDLWQYDPSTDSWEAKTSLGGKKRAYATAFVLNDRAYVCMGTDNGEYLGDLWEYDADANEWTEKRKIENDANEDEGYDDDYEIVGIYATSFTKAGLGYVATGGPGYPGVRTWEYDPDQDIWTERSNFEGSNRYGAVSFTLNDIPYVATGRSSGTYFDDVWRFNPNEEQDDDD